MIRIALFFLLCVIPTSVWGQSYYIGVRANPEITAEARIKARLLEVEGTAALAAGSENCSLGLEKLKQSFSIEPKKRRLESILQAFAFCGGLASNEASPYVESCAKERWCRRVLERNEYPMDQLARADPPDTAVIEPDAGPTPAPAPPIVEKDSHLRVRVKPPKGAASINDVRVVVGGQYELPRRAGPFAEGTVSSGCHDLIVMAQGYDAFRAQACLDPGARKTLRFELLVHGL